MKLITAIACGTALLVTAPVGAQKIKDTIIQTDGARVRGVEVTSMTADSITYKRGSKESKLSASKVQTIDWHEPPESYLIAQVAMTKGNFEKAANFYKEAETGTSRPVFQAELKFQAADALLRAAGEDVDKAAGAQSSMEDYVSSAPDGLRIPAARLAIARAVRLQGEAAEAETKLTEYENLAIQNSWGLIWDARAKFEKALAQVALNKHAEARSTYRGVISAVDAALNSGDTDPQLHKLKSQSVVGEGETFIAEGQYDQALIYFQKFENPTSPNQPTSVQAAAYAGKGQALFMKGSTNQDHKALRDAQVALAMANLLDIGDGSTTAKALYFTGKVLLAISSDKEKDKKARAAAYFDAVTRFYASTPWASLAREELSR